MRSALWAVAAAVAIAANPAATTAMLSSTAAALLEAAPFILAGLALRAACGKWIALLPYLDCGCSSGSSARSLPAAIATLAVFGPFAALARVSAATAASRIRQGRALACDRTAPAVLAQLATLAPVAALGAAASAFFPLRFLAHAAGPAGGFAAGALAGLLCAPCALGAVAFAAALRPEAPFAAAGFLCTAGIVDLRVWLRTNGVCPSAHDACAYLAAASACAILAAHHCAGLLHPRFTLALWACAAAFGAATWRYRTSRSSGVRLAALTMLAGTLISSPPPQYHATQTTLDGGFAGEAVDFTGVVTHTGGVTTLVRYAITCCRVDAAPIVVRLAHEVSVRGWARARGILEPAPGGLRMRISAIESAPAPPDPFVYR